VRVADADERLVDPHGQPEDAAPGQVLQVHVAAVLARRNRAVRTLAREGRADDAGERCERDRNVVALRHTRDGSVGQVPDLQMVARELLLGE
jgi:hypothetical protein